MTDRGCDRFDEVGPLVAVGAATPKEAQALETHLGEGCAACAVAQRDWRETAARLAGVLPPVTPPASIKTQLLETIVQENAVSPVRRSHRSGPTARGIWPWAAGWAMAAALALVLVYNLDLQRKTAARNVAELQTLSRALSDKESALQFVEARQTHTVWLKGQDRAPKTLGKVFWNPEANAGLLVAFDLPSPPPGKVYQLWAVHPNSPPVNAGIFSPDANGTGTLNVKPLPDPKRNVDYFAVTDEPAGGSPKPTGSVFLKGIPMAF